jgi:CheY-like chemotaxis protein
LEFDVIAAASGADALARLAEGARPSLILLDLMMPGMSGVELHALLRRDPALAKIPVVVISGGARVDETAAGMNAAGFLVKPFELDALVAMVRRHVSP